MTSFDTWLDKFLEEKELPRRAWQITSSAGVEHFITSDVVIEAIRSAPAIEQRGIRKTIVKIDFCNGDVNHFFKHLATALVERF